MDHGSEPTEDTPESIVERYAAGEEGRTKGLRRTGPITYDGSSVASSTSAHLLLDTSTASPGMLMVILRDERGDWRLDRLLECG